MSDNMRMYINTKAYLDYFYELQKLGPLQMPDSNEHFCFSPLHLTLIKLIDDNCFENCKALELEWKTPPHGAEIALIILIYIFNWPCLFPHVERKK